MHDEMKRALFFAEHRSSAMPYNLEEREEKMSEVKRDFTGKSVVDCFQQEIEIVIETYKKDGLKLGEAIGALEIVKLNLWKEQTEEAPSLAQEKPPQNTMEAGQNNGQQAKP